MLELGTAYPFCIAHNLECGCDSQFVNRYFCSSLAVKSEFVSANACMPVEVPLNPFSILPWNAVSEYDVTSLNVGVGWLECWFFKEKLAIFWLY